MKRIILNALLFVSGLCALVYQVAWLRAFSLILGSTIYSMSCVVTVVMLGLAGGSFWARRLLRRSGWVSRNPLLAYGSIEGLTGLVSLAVTVVLFRDPMTWLQWASAGGPAAGPWQSLPVHFLLTLVLLLVPGLLMGATLPVVCVLASDMAQVPTLYGFNTMGAAVGSLAASFVFIYYWGCYGAAAVAAALNLAVFVVAACLNARFRPLSLPVSRTLPSGVAPAGGHDSPVSPGPDAGRIPALLVAVVSGFIILSLEVTWTRILQLVLGNRIYVTSITLFVILMCLGYGARMAAVLLRKWAPSRVVILACSVALLSFGVAFMVQARMLGFLISTAPVMQGKAVAARAAYILFLVVFPATATGLLFPSALAGRRTVGGTRDSGRWVGLVYGVNTLASVAGALLAGYVFIEGLGSIGIVVLNAVLLAVLAGVMIVTCRQELPRRLRMLGLLAIAAVPVLILPRAVRSPPLFPAGVVEFSAEDAHGLFTVVRAEGGRLRVLNNNTDLVYLCGDRVTQYVQETQAYLPALHARRLGAVLNIGSGYGITAGAFTRLAEVGRVDAVEIVPWMVKSASRFAAWNHDYWKDPRVHIHVTDGRHYLAASTNRYDIISINPSDPYLPGSASLYSRDFYELIRARLNPGGVLCHHVFGPDAVSIYHGIKAVFPFMLAIPSYGGGAGGITVIAATEPLQPHQASLMRQRYDEGRRLLAPIGIESLDAFLALIRAGDGIRAEIEARAPAFEETDARPVLEFRRGGAGQNLLYASH